MWVQASSKTPAGYHSDHIFKLAQYPHPKNNLNPYMN